MPDRCAEDPPVTVANRPSLVLLVEAGVELHDPVNIQREPPVRRSEQRLARREAHVDRRAGFRLVDRILHRRDLGLLLLLGVGDLGELLLLRGLLLLDRRGLFLRLAQLRDGTGELLTWASSALIRASRGSTLCFAAGRASAAAGNIERQVSACRGQQADAVTRVHDAP